MEVVRRFRLVLATAMQGATVAVVLSVAMVAAPAPVAAQQCTSVACVTAGPRLVSVDSNQSILLNALFQALLPGTSVQLSVLDWNALAGADINLNLLLTQLGTNLGVSDPSQVLTTEITLGDLQLAMVQVLQADGNTAAANALQLLPLNVPGLSGTIQLAGLLQLSLPPGSLAEVNLDLLDLITGGVQLYNFENVLTTGDNPVTIDTAALGLAGLANVQLWLQVVEPPVYVCGPEGTQFHSAAVRAKLNFEVVDGFDLQPLIDAINALGLVGVSNLSLTQGALVLDLYADIARAQGTITQIDALAQMVTVDAEPGIVDLFIGDIDDAVFFNRAETIEPTDFAPQDISTLDLRFNVQIPLVGDVSVQVPLTVSAFAAAQGDPGIETLIFAGPYPKTQTVDSGAVSAGTLATSLINSLNLEVTAGPVTATVLGVPVSEAVLTDIINNFVNPMVNVIESTLQATSGAVLEPALTTVLGGVVDPLLGLLGIGLGEAVITVDGIAQACRVGLVLTKSLQPPDNAGLFNLAIELGGIVVASATDVGHGGSTGIVDTEPGGEYALSESAGTGTDPGTYVSTWSCVDGDNSQVASGTGTNFVLTAPDLLPQPVVYTCTFLNRGRSADLSISKADNSTTYTPGGSATYVITVSNAGPDAVVGAVVTDNLPAGATLSAPWGCTATSGTCQAASGGAVGDTSINVVIDLEVVGEAVIEVPVVFGADPAAY